MNAARVLRVPVVAALAALACSGSPEPAAVTPADTCAFCRMAVSDARFAAQIVRVGDEPRFFDDIGCVASALRQAPLAADARAYVADHRTRAWVPIRSAIYSRVPGLSTPMGSGLVAHADEASRRADPDAAGGEVVNASSLFGEAAAGETP